MIAGAVACVSLPSVEIRFRLPWRATYLVRPDWDGGIATVRGRTMKTFINMLRDDSGASAAEYALILAIIGAVIALAALGLSKAIGNAMNNTATCINSPGAGNVPNC
jgi:pilus assembly protein Flp/PilA